jgi:hypothetical protein
MMHSLVGSKRKLNPFFTLSFIIKGLSSCFKFLCLKKAPLSPHPTDSWPNKSSVFVFGLCRDLHSSDYMKHRIKYLGLSHGNSNVNIVLKEFSPQLCQGNICYDFPLKSRAFLILVPLSVSRIL